MANGMTTTLKERYIEAISKEHNLNDYETTTLLHKTSWVRILLEQHYEDEAVHIEVEVSIPEGSSLVHTNEPLVFDAFAEHITYLQRLREHGFELCIISEGCILSASKVIHETPKDNLFSALCPP
jgi:hypothetical protein